MKHHPWYSVKMRIPLNSACFWSHEHMERSVSGIILLELSNHKPTGGPSDKSGKWIPCLRKDSRQASKHNHKPSKKGSQERRKHSKQAHGMVRTWKWSARARKATSWCPKVQPRKLRNNFNKPWQAVSKHNKNNQKKQQMPNKRRSGETIQKPPNHPNEPANPNRTTKLSNQSEKQMNTMSTTCCVHSHLRLKARETNYVYSWLLPHCCWSLQEMHEHARKSLETWRNV